VRSSVLIDLPMSKAKVFGEELFSNGFWKLESSLSGLLAVETP
jgi:hypothetical protein